MDSPATSILIFGARSIAQEIADLATVGPGLRVAGFVENLDRDSPRILHVLPVRWIDDVASLAASHKAVCGLGTTLRAPLITQVCGNGIRIHVGHPSVSAGLFPRCDWRRVDRMRRKHHRRSHGDWRLRRNQPGRIDWTPYPICRLHEHRTGANIGGGCRIGEGVCVGIGATVIDQMQIGPVTVIGRGAVVTRDLPARELAIGIPAKIVEEYIEGK